MSVTSSVLPDSSPPRILPFEFSTLTISLPEVDDDDQIPIEIRQKYRPLTTPRPLTPAESHSVRLMNSVLPSLIEANELGSSHEKSWGARLSIFIHSDQLKRIVGMIAYIAISSGLGVLVAGILMTHGWLVMGGVLTSVAGTYTISRKEVRPQLPQCMQRCLL